MIKLQIGEQECQEEVVPGASEGAGHPGAGASREEADEGNTNNQKIMH